MNITIIGGGNIGTLMAGELAYRGHAVTIHSSRPTEWTGSIDVLDPDGALLFTGKLTKVTSDLREAVTDAEMILVTVPAIAFRGLARELLPHVTAGQMIGVVPGSGGAEFAFADCIRKGCTLFGLQRVHSIARLKAYGAAVHMLGRKASLSIGSIPAASAPEICRLMETLFEIPSIPLKNYLAVTLTPSNPILHTTRLYAMFRDWHAGVVYPENFLFYESWSNASSAMLLACDAEEQTLCNAIPLDLSEVVSLATYYEGATAQAITDKIRGIPAFRGLTSPMCREADGWIPDLSSRYFTADFSYGLKIILDIAKLFHVETPHIEEVWSWYAQLANPRDVFALPTETADAFLALYTR